MKIPSNRKGFKIPVPEVIVPQAPEFSDRVHGPIVYWNSKFTHSGVIGYKSFDNCFRKQNANSLSNLLNRTAFENYVLLQLIQDFKSCKNDDQRSNINDQAITLLDKQEYSIYLMHTKQTRHLNHAQCRKIKTMSNKLAYYSQTRQFTSKKTGKYTMRVAFLTLTAPECADPKAVNKAFHGFLDYLQRTANCVYVWKKELGEENHKLHFHVLINNFIPYYIISWKWKRLLLAQNVHWTVTESGKDSDSHYRIELPRNKKQTAHYISKYMSKAYDLPNDYGYISGHSSILNELKEVVLIEGEFPEDEIKTLCNHFKVIRTDYVSIICVDLLHVRKMCPLIGELFEAQYVEFSQKITLPQRFKEV
jgi:hypothetical protein